LPDHVQDEQKLRTPRVGSTDNPGEIRGESRMAQQPSDTTIFVMDPSAFTSVLGHSRVLSGVLDPGNRVIAYDGESAVGVAAFEPLFGPRAEGAIALTAGASGGLTHYLLDGLLELASRSGIHAVRFVFETTQQRRTADRMLGSRAECVMRRNDVEIRTPRIAPTVTDSLGERS